MNLSKLRNYPMDEAIYICAFGISREDLENKPREEVIADYEHLRENVKDALDTLPERERTSLQLVLGDKLTLRAAGDVMHITGTRVEQIFNKAFRMLRHDSRRHILDGTRRQQKIVFTADQERKSTIEKIWVEVGTEIEQQMSQQLDYVNAHFPLRVDSLQLTPLCVRKLRVLGVETIGDLFKKFPYDPQTNGLKGLATADGIEKTDYQDIWCALFTAKLLIRMPELPDFEAIRKAEWAALMGDDMPTPKALDISVRDLYLSERSYNRLIRGGVSSVDDLLSKLGLDAYEFLEKDRQDVIRMIQSLKIRHIGPTCAGEIVDCLRDLLSSNDV